MSTQTTDRHSALRGMEETSTGRSRNGLLLSIALTAALVVAVNLATGSYLRENTRNLGAWLLNEKWQLLDQQTEPVKVLVLGDSSCNQGFNNRVLNKELRTTSLNLCTIGSVGLAGDAWMLEEYVKHVGIPEQVLVIHTYDVWPRNIHQSVWANIPRPTLPFTQTALDFNFTRIRDALLTNTFPLYSQEVSVKGLLLGDARRLLVTGGNPPRQPNFKLDQFGFMAEKRAQPASVKSDFNSLRRSRYLQAKVSRDNKKALASLVATSKKHGIKLRFANGPMFEGVFEEPKLKQFVENMTKTVQKEVKAHGSSAYCAQASPQPITQMQNLDHVTLQGSVDYTRRLAMWLAGDRAAARACR